MIKFIIKVALAAAIGGAVAYGIFLAPFFTQNAMNLLVYFALASLIVEKLYGNGAEKESK